MGRNRPKDIYVLLLVTMLQLVELVNAEVYICTFSLMKKYQKIKAVSIMALTLISAP
jgi:hypothetical protein